MVPELVSRPHRCPFQCGRAGNGASSGPSSSLSLLSRNGSCVRAAAGGERECHRGRRGEARRCRRTGDVDDDTCGMITTQSGPVSF